MDRVVTHFFRGFSVQAMIGVHPAEKAAPQRILIELEYDYVRPIGPDDRISTVLDYDGVRSEVEEIVHSRHFNLQETLCEAILAGLMGRPEVARAKVSTRKPDVYPNVEAVGVSLEATKG